MRRRDQIVQLVYVAVVVVLLGSLVYGITQKGLGP